MVGRGGEDGNGTIIKVNSGSYIDDCGHQNAMKFLPAKLSSQIELYYIISTATIAVT